MTIKLKIQLSISPELMETTKQLTDTVNRLLDYEQGKKTEITAAPFFRPEMELKTVEPTKDTEPEPQAAVKPKKAPAKTKPATQEPEAPAAKTEVTEDMPVPTLGAIQELSRVKAQAGKKDAIKALLAQYGVDKLSALDPGTYVEFHIKLKAL
jgi:hypothetical protein